MVIDSEGKGEEPSVVGRCLLRKNGARRGPAGVTFLVSGWVREKGVGCR